VLEAGYNVQGLQTRRLRGGHRQTARTNVRCLAR
jgi:hypothetical protein